MSISQCLICNRLKRLWCICVVSSLRDAVARILSADSVNSLLVVWAYSHEYNGHRMHLLWSNIVIVCTFQLTIGSFMRTPRHACPMEPEEEIGIRSVPGTKHLSTLCRDFYLIACYPFWIIILEKASANPIKPSQAANFFKIRSKRGCTLASMPLLVVTLVLFLVYKCLQFPGTLTIERHGTG